MPLDDQRRNVVREHAEILSYEVAFSSLDVADQRAPIEAKAVEQGSERDGGNAEAPAGPLRQPTGQEVTALIEVGRLTPVRNGGMNDLELRPVSIAIPFEHGEEIRVGFHHHVSLRSKQPTIGQGCHHADAAAELDHG